MTTVNADDQDDNKDKVSETETPKETTPEAVSELQEDGDKNEDDDDDGGGRDVAPVSGKKGK